MITRAAEQADLAPLARLWWSGWRDAHLAILPETLERLHTLESFEARMGAALSEVLGPWAQSGRPWVSTC